jgi:hypothetical protein
MAVVSAAAANIQSHLSLVKLLTNAQADGFAEAAW